MDLAKEIYDFIVNNFELGEDEAFDFDDNLFDNGIIDSLDATEVINFLEENWNIEITQKDVMMFPMNTINEIATVVGSKL